MTTSVPISPWRLLRHADELAGSGGRGPEWLRRSVSASYYALFHGVALATAAHLAPTATGDRARLARSIDHGRVREVCQWLAGTPGGGKEHVRAVVADLRVVPALVELARTFTRLLEARHRADYDHLATFDTATALLYAEEAERGLDLLGGMADTVELQRFLSLVALHSSLR